MSYYNQRDHFSYHQLYFFFKQYFQHKAQNKRNLTLVFQSSVLGIGEEPSELEKMAHMLTLQWVRKHPCGPNNCMFWAMIEAEGEVGRP